MRTRSLINGMMVSSESNFVVYGSARGIVCQCNTYEEAAKALEADRHGCLKQGGYSDAAIYQDDGSGHWENADTAELEE